MADQSEDESQKTEEPTHHRLEKAREEGQVFLSREVLHWIVLAFGTLLCFGIIPFIHPKIIPQLTYFIHSPHNIPITFEALHYRGSEIIKIITLHIGATLLVLVFILMIVGLVQTQFTFSVKSLAPKLERISVAQGLKRLFGKKSLVEFMKNIFKIIIIAGVILFLLSKQWTQLQSFHTVAVESFFHILVKHLAPLFFTLLSILGVISLIDLSYQWVSYRKGLRMSRQEVKQEHKDHEGDPTIRNRLRQIRQSRSKRRMMSRVKEATAIVTNPTHYAIALLYEMEEMAAPVIIAKGVDFLALKIKEVAKENKIPVFENPPLARALFASTEIDQEIPPEHYAAVAKIIKLVLAMKKKRF